MQTLAALLSTFGLTKTEEQKIQEAIAEQLKDPTQEPPGIPTPAPPPRKSRVEELAHAMEMVETSNQNPKTLGVRLNNPDCLKFVKGKLNTGTSKHQRVRQVPNLQLRQASTTPLTPIRDDR